jgi:hypothetical protein
MNVLVSATGSPILTIRHGLASSPPRSFASAQLKSFDAAAYAWCAAELGIADVARKGKRGPLYHCRREPPSFLEKLVLDSGGMLLMGVTAVPLTTRRMRRLQANYLARVNRRAHTQP